MKVYKIVHPLYKFLLVIILLLFITDLVCINKDVSFVYLVHYSYLCIVGLTAIIGIINDFLEQYIEKH